jgi:3-methyladenine DNA glycosylase/8-oxoguanine DNA glycosylase
VEKTRTLILERPLDLRKTLLVTGLKGPTKRIAAGAYWRAARTPDGPGTLRLSISGGELEGAAWGPGAEWLLDRMPAMVGEHDSADGFDPHHAAVQRLHRRGRAVRLPSVGTMLDVLVPVILGQKVTGSEAATGYKNLLHTYGEPAPGPAELVLAPPPELLAGLPYYDYHPLGIEKKRAETIIAACAVAHRLERLVEGPLDVAYAELERVRGIGPWTSARTMMVVAGDPDAVPVGDYHIPNSVAWAIAGEPRGTDERMLELLAPYSGQRGRVVRLIEVYGGHAPRYGPRLAPRRFEDH